MPTSGDLLLKDDAIEASEFPSESPMSADFNADESFAPSPQTPTKV